MKKNSNAPLYAGIAVAIGLSFLFPRLGFGSGGSNAEDIGKSKEEKGNPDEFILTIGDDDEGLIIHLGEEISFDRFVELTDEIELSKIVFRRPIRSGFAEKALISLRSRGRLFTEKDE